MLKARRCVTHEYNLITHSVSQLTRSGNSNIGSNTGSSISNESVFCHACRVLYYKHTHTASQAHVPQQPTQHTNFDNRQGAPVRLRAVLPHLDAGGLETGVPRGLSLDVLLLIRMCCLPHTSVPSVQ